MPDAETGAPAEAPKVDIFGVDLPVAEAQPQAADADSTTEGDGGEGGDKKPLVAKADWKPGDPIEQNPVVVGLKNEIESVKKEYGGNLSGQRAKIDELQAKIDELTGKGKKDETPAAEPLYKDIKRVADLSAEEQEAMTDTEKRLFDEAADLKENLNKLHLEGATRAAESENRTTEQFKETSQNAALKLAGGDKALANQIIEQFNKFAGNEKLTDTQIEARMEEATKLVPNYKPPKEQQRPNGKPVNASGQGEDPFGVQKFVDEAKASKSAGEFPL